MTTIVIMMMALTDDYEYENEEGRGGDGTATEPMTPTRWKEVQETYQGCILETTLFNLTGGVMYVNLSQVG